MSAAAPMPGPRRSVLLAVALTLLAVLALATRLPAPWRAEVTLDEMLHLESWKNRYGTDDRFPVFRARIQETGALSPEQKAWLAELYDTSPWFQRWLFIHSDAPSAAFALVAETVRELSDSNIAAVRLVSVFTSLLAVYLAYLLGTALADRSLGVCVAAMFALSPLAQIYAGIGRPHVTAHCGIVLLMFTFLGVRTGRFPLRYFLGAALLSQLSYTAAWAMTAPLIAAELLIRFWDERSISRLVRQFWVYAALSSLVLMLFVVQATGTSAVTNINYPGSLLPRYFSVASPFAHLGAVVPYGIYASGVATIALGVLGAKRLLAPGQPRPVARFAWSIVGMSVSAIVAMVIMCHQRHLNIYSPPFLLLAGVGFHALFATPFAALRGAVALMVVLAPIAIFAAEDPYKYVLEYDTPYSAIAQKLEEEIEAGDGWTAFPYFLANVLYPYASLPEPVLTYSTFEEYREIVESRSTGYAFFALRGPAEARDDPAFALATERWEFPESHLILLRIPPGAGVSAPTSDAPGPAIAPH